jgi:predicted ABC-type ATPase
MHLGKAKPRLFIIAGPNGAGKTTFAGRFLPHYAHCREFINADLIAGELSPFDPTAAAFRAGRLMLEQIHALSRHRRDFSFETTLSGRSYLPLLRRLRADGYSIRLFFLWIPDVKLALARVADRVRQGGHDVPEAVVRRRFSKGIENFFRYYRPLLDAWCMLDNSTETPAIIASEEAGRMHVANPGVFAKVIQTSGLE